MRRDERFALRMQRQQQRAIRDAAREDQLAHLAAIALQQGGNVLTSAAQAMATPAAAILVAGVSLAALEHRNRSYEANALATYARLEQQRAAQLDRWSQLAPDKRGPEPPQLMNREDYLDAHRPYLSLDGAQALAIGAAAGGGVLGGVFRGMFGQQTTSLQYDIPDVEVRTPGGALGVASAALPMLPPPPPPRGNGTRRRRPPDQPPPSDAPDAPRLFAPPQFQPQLVPSDELRAPAYQPQPQTWPTAPIGIPLGTRIPAPQRAPQLEPPQGLPPELWTIPPAILARPGQQLTTRPVPGTGPMGPQLRTPLPTSPMPALEIEPTVRVTSTPPRLAPPPGGAAGPPQRIPAPSLRAWLTGLIPHPLLQWMQLRPPPPPRQYQ